MSAPLTDAQVGRYADVLIWGLGLGRRFRRHDTVLVRLDSAAAWPLAEAVHRRLLGMRLNVVLRVLSSPGAEKDFYTLTDAAQRKFIPAGERELFESLNGLVAIRAPESLTHLRDVDAKRLGETTLARKPLRDIMNRREDRGEFSWTLCSWPTEAPAKNARLSPRAFAAQIAKACFLDDRDPVARWRSIHAEAAEIKKWLASLRISAVRLRSPSMDLEIRIGERRAFRGVSGRNIPSFELFTSPDWRGTRGTYFADMPSFRSGNYVEGLRLEFRAGKAVKVSARSGEEFSRKTLSLDPGAAAIGEFSLTDVRFSRIDRFMADTLFDENFGGRHGNCHIAMGNSYADTFDGDPSRLTEPLRRRLGFNGSSIHWDIVNTEPKTVTARLRDGRDVTIYEAGKFRY